MIQRKVRASALLPCTALILGGVALQASTIKSERFTIPFDFQVEKHQTLPAGQYEVQQAAGSDMAVLVNTRTGERVQFLRPSNTHQEGKARLVFEGADGHYLKRIS